MIRVERNIFIRRKSNNNKKIGRIKVRTRYSLFGGWNYYVLLKLNVCTNFTIHSGLINISSMCEFLLCLLDDGAVSAHILTMWWGEIGAHLNCITLITGPMFSTTLIFARKQCVNHSINGPGDTPVAELSVLYAKDISKRYLQTFNGRRKTIQL